MPASNKIEINGQYYYVFTDAFTLGTTITAGIYYALPPYGAPPRISPVTYDYRNIPYPGINWQFTKNYGKRTRDIYVELIVVGTTKSDCEGRLRTLYDSVEQMARYSIVWPGTSTEYQGCKLMPGGANVIDHFTIDNCVCCSVGLRFWQLSETN